MTITTQRSSIADIKAEFRESAVGPNVISMQNDRTCTSFVIMISAIKACVMIPLKHRSAPLTIFRTMLNAITFFCNSTTPKVRSRSSSDFLSQAFNRFWRSSLTGPSSDRTFNTAFAGVQGKFSAAIKTFRFASFPSRVKMFWRTCFPSSSTMSKRRLHSYFEILYSLCRTHLMTIGTRTTSTTPSGNRLFNLEPCCATGNAVNRHSKFFISLGRHAAIIAVLVVLFSAPSHAVTTQSVKLHQGATAVDNCAVVTNCPLVEVKGYTTIVFQILGPFTGSVQFESAIDKNAGWTPLECFAAANRSSSTTAATAPGAWRCNVIGFNFARPRIDTYSAGSITILAGVVSAGVL